MYSYGVVKHPQYEQIQLKTLRGNFHTAIKYSTTYNANTLRATFNYENSEERNRKPLRRKFPERIALINSINLNNYIRYLTAKR